MNTNALFFLILLPILVGGGAIMITASERRRNKRIFKLQNGAKIIDRKSIDDGAYLVLADNGSYNKQIVQPWAVWQCDKDGNCFYGHYFSTLSNASKHFEDEN